MLRVQSGRRPLVLLVGEWDRLSTDPEARSEWQRWVREAGGWCETPMATATVAACWTCRRRALRRQGRWSRGG